MTNTAERCLRCQAPMAGGAIFCQACGIAKTAAATGEYPVYDLERFFNYAVDLLCIAGTDGYLKLVNPAFERTLGFTAEELQARPFAEFIHPEDRSETVAEIGKLASGDPTLSFENRYRCKDGSYRYLHWTSFPEPATGLLYAVARDVTEWRRSQGQVDPLTGLVTDIGFDARLPQEWSRARRAGLLLSVAILDLDRFKHFNERYGYSAGDQCLTRVGALARSRMRRASDLTARIGGQRLGLVMSGGTEAQAIEVCEAIRRDVAALGISHEGITPPGPLTVSAGVAAAIPDPAHRPDTFLEAAATALGEAKDGGGNAVIAHRLASQS